MIPTFVLYLSLVLMLILSLQIVVFLPFGKPCTFLLKARQYQLYWVTGTEVKPLV